MSKQSNQVSSESKSAVVTESPAADKVADYAEVRQLAYSYWQARGCPDGSPKEDWFRAERELSIHSLGLAVSSDLEPGKPNMQKTAVGLFEDRNRLEDVVREIEALGFPRKEVRTLEEPGSFEVTGVMSFPRVEFEVDLIRELRRIGATEAEAQAYVEGLRRGGALLFATGSDEKVEAAADIMNRHGAVEVEETSGPEPFLPHVVHENMTPIRDSTVLAGRVRQPGGGASFFVW